jgi:hypothetical protein
LFFLAFLKPEFFLASWRSEPFFHHSSIERRMDHKSNSSSMEALVTYSQFWLVHKQGGPKKKIPNWFY